MFERAAAGVDTGMAQSAGNTKRERNKEKIIVTIIKTLTKITLKK